MDKGGAVAGGTMPKVICGANTTVIGIGVAATMWGALKDTAFVVVFCA